MTPPLTRSEAEIQRDIEALHAAVDQFAAAMKTKLAVKAREGWYGWQESENEEAIWERLESHVRRGRSQVVDIANLAMMLWHQDQQS